MQGFQKFRLFAFFALLFPAPMVLPGCHRALRIPVELQIRDESGAVVAKFTDIRFASADPEEFAIEVQDADKGRLESVSKGNLGKSLTIEVTGFPAQKATVMSPIKDGSFIIDGAAGGSGKDLLKPFKPRE